jgi:hypothetical protein
MPRRTLNRSAHSCQLSVYQPRVYDELLSHHPHEHDCKETGSNGGCDLIAIQRNVGHLTFIDTFINE